MSEIGRDQIYENSDLSETEIDAARKFAREKPSTSYLQRKMNIPYNHAMRIMGLLEAEGFVTRPRADGRRDLGPAAPSSRKRIERG